MPASSLLTSYENASRRHRLRKQHRDPSTRAEALVQDGRFVISDALAPDDNRLFLVLLLGALVNFYRAPSLVGRVADIFLRAVGTLGRARVTELAAMPDDLVRK